MRAVRWDAAELYDWLKYIEARLSETRGIAVNGWGVHTQENHILLYLEKVESLTPLLDVLERHHVPCYLVKIAVVGPITIA